MKKIEQFTKDMKEVAEKYKELDQEKQGLEAKVHSLVQ
jgi:hypothetical protein